MMISQEDFLSIPRFFSHGNDKCNTDKFLEDNSSEDQKSLVNETLRVL